VYRLSAMGEASGFEKRAVRQRAVRQLSPSCSWRLTRLSSAQARQQDQRGRQGPAGQAGASCDWRVARRVHHIGDTLRAYHGQLFQSQQVRSSTGGAEPMLPPRRPGCAVMGASILIPEMFCSCLPFAGGIRGKKSECPSRVYIKRSGQSCSC
jgi:hypothetical protein